MRDLNIENHFDEMFENANAEVKVPLKSQVIFRIKSFLMDNEIP